jgi:lambda repressor-like predicted transcriptional regulator
MDKNCAHELNPFSKGDNSMESNFEELSACLPDNLESDPEFILKGIEVDIASELTGAMRKAGMSMEELSERSGVKLVTLDKMLHHAGSIRFETLAKIAAALGVRPTIKLVK